MLQLPSASKKYVASFRAKKVIAATPLADQPAKIRGSRVEKSTGYLKALRRLSEAKRAHAVLLAEHTAHCHVVDGWSRREASFSSEPVGHPVQVARQQIAALAPKLEAARQAVIAAQQALEPFEREHCAKIRAEANRLLDELTEAASQPLAHVEMVVSRLVFMHDWLDRHSPRPAGYTSFPATDRRITQALQARLNFQQIVHILSLQIETIEDDRSLPAMPARPADVQALWDRIAAERQKHAELSRQANDARTEREQERREFGGWHRPTHEIFEAAEAARIAADDWQNEYALACQPWLAQCGHILKQAVRDFEPEIHTARATLTVLEDAFQALRAFVSPAGGSTRPALTGPVHFELQWHIRSLNELLKQGAVK